jgi:polyisoprenoid-binding protein YceI
MLKSAFASLLVFGALAAASVANAAGPPAWIVDKAHSKLTFSSAFSGTKFTGGFNDWSATIVFDPANLAASKASVSINLASAKSGDEDRDENLPTPDWFSVAKFPKATFTTTSIKALGGDKYQAAGVINLKGVSKPATLNFSLKISGPQATMTGQAVLDRTQWSVGQGQFAAESPVPHAVTIDVAVSAQKGG